MKYTIYSQSTGQISRRVTCEEDTIDSQYNPATEEFVAGDIDDELYYIADGQPVLIPESSDPEFLFNWETKLWEDTRTLQSIKEARWAMVKKDRTTAEFAEFTYNGMVFDGDVDAQRRLAGYISISKGALASNQPFQAEFTLANNTNVMLNADDFVHIELAKVQAVAAAFARASSIRELIDASTSIEELNLISWDTAVV